MKLAMSNLSWDPSENDAVAESLRTHGARGVELAPTKVWQDLTSVPKTAAEEERSAWEQRGFPIVCLQSLLFGRLDLTVFETDEARERTFDALDKIAGLAGTLGAGAVVFGSPKNRKRGELPLDKAMSIAVPFFKRVAESYGRNGVAFCFEPNPDQYGCDFCQNTTDVLALVNAVDHPAFRMNLDLSSLILNGEPVAETTRSALPYTGHVHISEPYLKSIGEHPDAHRELCLTLRDAGYQGWISIELIGQKNGGQTSVEDALRFCREIYG